MSHIGRAADIIQERMDDESDEPAYSDHGDDHAREAAHDLDRAGLLAPAPQIIRTVEELEDLDHDTVVLDGVGEIYPVRYYLDADDDEKTIYERYLPAVKVAEGAHVRACREALEGGPL